MLGGEVGTGVGKGDEGSTSEAWEKSIVASETWGNSILVSETGTEVTRKVTIWAFMKLVELGKGMIVEGIVQSAKLREG